MIPGFSAETALYGSQGVYQATYSQGSGAPSRVVPSGILDWAKCAGAAIVSAGACAGSAGAACVGGGVITSALCADALDKTIKGE